MHLGGWGGRVLILSICHHFEGGMLCRLVLASAYVAVATSVLSHRYVCGRSRAVNYSQDLKGWRMVVRVRLMIGS